MSQPMQFDELDTSSRRYLQRVRQAAGEGFPGVFIKHSGALPWIGLGVGLAVLIATWFYTWPPLEDPTNLAMLQTAGLLLGGWMVLAAVRVWWGQFRASHGGYFVYADPLCVWEVDGYSVHCTKMDDVVDIHYQENFNNEGAYQNTSLGLALTQGNRAVTVQNQEGGALLCNYIGALLQMRLDPDWNNVSPAEKGKNARNTALGQVGREAESAQEEEAILVEPHRERRAGYGWLNLLVVSAVGVLLFVGLRSLNRIERDDALFALVKNASPAELRGYLLDHRNQRHRDEVKALLRKHYDGRFAILEQKAKEAALVPELADLHRDVLKILDALAVAEFPILSVRITGAPAQDQIAQPPDVAVRQHEQLRKQLADALELTLGAAYIVCAEAPDQVPAMLDIRYEPHADPGQTKWTLTFRKGPEQEPFLSRDWTSKNPAAALDRSAAVRADFRQLVLAMTGYDAGPLAHLLPMAP